MKTFLLRFRRLAVHAVSGALLASLNFAHAGMNGSFYAPTTDGGGWFTGLAAHGGGTLYGRTDVGGLYKSNDHGDTWKFLSGNMTSPGGLSVQGVAVKPTNVNVVLQCVGTSDYPNDPNRGVWRSVDGGATWTQVLSGVNFSGNDQERWGGECVTFSPQNTDEAWVGTRGQGVWRSQDAGLTWGQLGIPPALGGYVTSISLPPPGRSDIWIGMSNGAIGVSGNNGINWTSLTGSYGGLNAPAGCWRIVRAPDQSIYVAGWNASGPVLFRFVAANWSNPSAYGWESITWPAKDPNQSIPLVAALADGRIVAGSLYGGGSYGGPRTQIRSTSGVWTNMDSLSGPMPAWQRPPAPTVIEGGRNALLVDPTDASRWFLAGGYAPFRTTNGGATWSYLTAGLNETVAYKVTFDPASDNRAFLPLADHGGAIMNNFHYSPRVENYITTRSLAYPDDLGLCRVMWSDGDKVVAPGTDERDQWKPRIYQSLNNGATWLVLSTNLPAQANRPIIAAVVSPDVRNDFLIALGGTDTGTVGGVYRTVNGGTTFARCTGLPINAGYGDQWTPDADLEADATNAAVRYLFLRNHGLYKSTNRGAAWSLLNTGLPNYGMVEADAVRSQTVWVGTCCAQPVGLARSTDGGASWTTIANFTRVDDVDAADGRVAVLGQRAGDTYNKVYYSDTNGGAWYEITRANHRLGNAQAVAVDPWHPGEVWISTNGSSVVRFSPHTAADDFDKSELYLFNSPVGPGFFIAWQYDDSRYTQGVNFNGSTGKGGEWTSGRSCRKADAWKN